VKTSDASSYSSRGPFFPKASNTFGGKAQSLIACSKMRTRISGEMSRRVLPELVIGFIAEDVGEPEVVDELEVVGGLEVAMIVLIEDRGK
jgi:hypothetical protein